MAFCILGKMEDNLWDISEENFENRAVCWKRCTNLAASFWRGRETVVGVEWMDRWLWLCFTVDVWFVNCPFVA